MPEASSPRPHPHTVLLSLAGHVDAPPEDVFDAVARRLAPSRDEYSFSADVETLFVVAQGGWWYRGEWQMLPEQEHDPEHVGTRIEYEIVNVAKIAHWTGPIVGRSVLRGAPLSFQALLTDVAAELEARGERPDEANEANETNETNETNDANGASGATDAVGETD